MDIIRVLKNNFAYIRIVQSDWDESIIPYIERYNSQFILQKKYFLL